MIEILTILLGLLTGPQTIELGVTGPVDRVEVRLNGEAITQVQGPPWEFRCDFGKELRPHSLEAIAFAADGRELGRDSRWINMGANQARAQLVLLPGPDGTPQALRVTWESIGQLRPKELGVSLDGVPLPFTDPEHIPLPELDHSMIHFVTATLRFADGSTSYLETGFGGELGFELTTELTPVAIEPTSRRLPSEKRLAKGFTAGGESVAIHGVERGEGHVVVVRDPSIQPTLDRLTWYVLKRVVPEPNDPERTGNGLLHRLENETPREKKMGDGVQTFGFGDSAPRTGRAGLRALATLGKESHIRFVSPESGRLAPEGVLPEVFLHSPAFAATEGGLGQLALAHPPQRFETRLADAVALAGSLAHSARGRRAVLLFLGDDSYDTSRLSPEEAQAYLRDLGVPLWVVRFGSGPTPWGEGFDLGSLDKPADAQRRFAQVFEELKKQLDRQRLVWLEGRHLPQDIALSDSLEGVVLTGR